MFSISVYSWDEAPDGISALRRQVFIDEQAVPPELEWDETDALADHFLLTDTQGQAIATARLYPSGTGGGGIGRMAVRSDSRGKGVGTTLLRAIMERGAEQYRFLHLSAQEQAIGFYQRAGFYVSSGSYPDAGIPHRDMHCQAPALVLSQSPESTAAMTLGEDTTTWAIGTQANFTALLCTLGQQTRRRLWIYDEFLSHDLYDDEIFADSISALARSSRRSDIRLLIHNDRLLIRRRHRLVQLMHRLPSNISLRLVNSSYPFEETPFVLADDAGVAYRYQFDSPAGFVNLSAPSRVRPLEEAFLRMWEMARPSVELRQLPL